MNAPSFSIRTKPVPLSHLPLQRCRRSGVDPDFQVHVSERLLDIRDGPFLELGLKGIAGTSIRLPQRVADRPDRDRLALRFAQFERAG